MNIFERIVGKSDEEKNQNTEVINEAGGAPENITSGLSYAKENNTSGSVLHQTDQSIRPEQLINDPVIVAKPDQPVEPKQTTTATVMEPQPSPATQPMSPSMTQRTPHVQQTQPNQPAPMPQSVTSNTPPKVAPTQTTVTTAQDRPVQMPRPAQPSVSSSAPSQSTENQYTSFPPCVNLGYINDGKFSDLYITPDKKTYIWGGKTNAGLQEVYFDDFEDFYNQINEAYDGIPSYLLKYNGRNYRVERTVATGGHQFCARKMPVDIPKLKSLGLPQGVYNHLLSLANCGGMILLAGATGSGKSTTIASLLKEYLCTAGGYAFTIEDPVELPLDGVYVTSSNELGLCKQTIPPNGVWAEGIKSALRSKPRYIYLGEIRSPDIASEALRAATSGHLVLSSIHANNVSEAVNSLIKYAASSGISEGMAYELVAGGLLGVVHQILSGAPKRAHVTTIFANPDVNAGCQVRGMIRSGKLNIATVMEQQRILLDMGKPLFK